LHNIQISIFYKQIKSRYDDDDTSERKIYFIKSCLYYVKKKNMLFGKININKLYHDADKNYRQYRVKNGILTI